LRTNEQPLDLQVTFAADADNDVLTIYYYINDTLNQTSLTNTTLNASDNDYKLSVYVHDGDTSGDSFHRNFSIDTVNPMVTINLPENNSYHNANIDVDLLCTDKMPYLLNYTSYNDTDIIKSVQNSTAEAEELKILDVIDISVLANDLYYMNISCSDVHTKKQIPDYIVDKDIISLKLTYTTDNQDNIGIKLKSADTTLNDFNTYKQDDRYVFWFEFAEDIEPTTHIYTFKIDNKNGLSYLQHSKYKAHFITDNNWVDFEFKNNELSAYKVIQTDYNKYEVQITTKQTFLLFESIGGLNVVTQQIQFTTDTTNPVITTAINNNTPAIDSIIQINGTCTDANGIQTMSVANNVSGTMNNVTTKTLNNVTSITYLYNHTAVSGVIAV